MMNHLSAQQDHISLSLPSSLFSTRPQSLSSSSLILLPLRLTDAVLVRRGGQRGVFSVAGVSNVPLVEEEVWLDEVDLALLLPTRLGRGASVSC